MSVVVSGWVARFRRPCAIRVRRGRVVVSVDHACAPVVRVVTVLGETVGRILNALQVVRCVVVVRGLVANFVREGLCIAVGIADNLRHREDFRS